jgi:hypothetical protein
MAKVAAAKGKGGLAILIAGKPGGPPDEGGAPAPEEGSAEEEAAESPEEEAAETEYPEFDVPEGLDLSDMEAGDEKEVLAVIRKTETGACIVSVEGIDLSGKPSPGGEEPSGEEAAANEAPPAESAPPPSGGGVGAGAAVRARAQGAGLM